MTKENNVMINIKGVYKSQGIPGYKLAAIASVKIVTNTLHVIV